jgi:hypothetical protein
LRSTPDDPPSFSSPSRFLRKAQLCLPHFARAALVLFRIDAEEDMPARREAAQLFQRAFGLGQFFGRNGHARSIH